MNEIRILGVFIKDREKESGNVQRLLTSFGCSIKTRLGLHDIDDNSSRPYGLIVLELTGLTEEMDKLELELRKLEGVEIQRMIF